MRAKSFRVYVTVCTILFVSGLVIGALKFSGVSISPNLEDVGLLAMGFGGIGLVPLGLWRNLL